MKRAEKIAYGVERGKRPEVANLESGNLQILYKLQQSPTEGSPMPPTNGKLLSVGRIAELCGCSQGTVRNWFDAGTLKGYRLAGKRGHRHRRVLRTDLRIFLARNKMPIPEALQVDAGGV